MNTSRNGGKTIKITRQVIILEASTLLKFAALAGGKVTTIYDEKLVPFFSLLITEHSSDCRRTEEKQLDSRRKI